MVSLVAASAAAQEQAEPTEQDETVEDKALVGAGTRAYDPEKAFFGPLPRYTTKDGKPQPRRRPGCSTSTAGYLTGTSGTSGRHDHRRS